MSQAYVLGLIFDAARRNVLLIRKNRPAFQAGRLNGLGGKVELGESPFQAIVREINEEANLVTTPEQWSFFGVMEGVGFAVHCFHAQVADLGLATAMTDESLVVLSVDDPRIHHEGLSNLTAVLSAALDQDNPFIRLRYRELAAEDYAAYDPQQPCTT